MKKIFVVILGDGTFRNCISLENVPFSNKITQMGAGAFADCKKLSAFVFDSKMGDFTVYATEGSTVHK